MHITPRYFRYIPKAVAAFIACSAILCLALLGIGDHGGLASAQEVQESQGTATELPGRSTSTSRTYRMPDGSFETRIYEVPVNYQDGKGDWRPIDQELEETASGAVTNGDNSFDVRLPENFHEAPLKVTLDEHWISQAPIGINTEAADFEDGVATYSTPDGEVEIEFSGLAHGLKETIELGGPSAPSTYHFRLDASAGVVPTLEEDGSIELRDETGSLVAEIPAPVMVDATEISAPEDAVKYALAPRDAGGWKLEVQADPQWLVAPERSWPVIIDPSVVYPSVTIAVPSRDCSIASNLTAQMCGNLGFTYMAAKAKYQSTGEDIFARALLRFNVSKAIPYNASLAAAKLGLYSAKTATNVTKVDLYDVRSEWNDSVTWTSPTGGTSKWTALGGDYGKEMAAPASVTTASRGSAPGWWNFSSASLVNAVEQWRKKAPSAEALNYGVLLKLADETSRVCCVERRVEWESSAGVYKPYLTVNYILPATADSKVSSPTDGTKTAKRFLLKAAWDHSNVEGVTFQYKQGNMWSDIPEGQVIDSSNQKVIWPYEVDSIDDRESEPLYWDASSLAGSQGTAEVQIRAVLAGSPGASGYTKPVKAELDQNIGGTKDATTFMGPGSVNLLTGNFTISRTDVSIPGYESSLRFSRTINSRDVSKGQNSQGYFTGDAGVLGQGWQAAAPVEQAGGSAWRSLKIESSTEQYEGETLTYKWAALTHSDGRVMSFEVDEKGLFVTPPEMSGAMLYRLDETRIALTDLDGNRTVFYNYGSGAEYLPISVAQPGGAGNKTRMIYEFAENKRRLHKVIAPAAPGIICPDEGTESVPGCRTLIFTYQNASTWGGGSFLGARLGKITYHAPGHGGPWDVARYSYNTNGRLIASWDPRISPSLEETYTYESTGQLKTLKPPGQEPWTMTYGTIAGEATGGRLMSIKRPSLTSGTPTAQFTLAYGVPLAQEGGGPYDMLPGDVSAWGQEDLPADATAIFPPDEVPASPPSSYARAIVYYMDAEGQTINVASPKGAGSSGESIYTTETDVFGNISRELTAENRLRALAVGEGASATKSKELDSQFKYSADGVLLVDERGPTHAVKLETGPEAGAIVQARNYRSIQYDKGAPEPPLGTPMPGLATHETTGALVGGKVLDQKTTEYKYNWNLRLQTESIVDPGGLAIKSVTKYDPDTSSPVEMRQPQDAETAGAGTAKISYYQAQSGLSPSGCRNDLYAGLPCQIEPAAQPASGPQLPVTRFLSYSALGSPTEVIEQTAGSTPGTRKRVTTYDAAGRQTSKEIFGGGVAIPKVTTSYSSSNGLPTNQRFVCPSSETGCDTQTLSTWFDALGRPWAYQDADGNLSFKSYDLNGRLATVNDGKGTQTVHYDPGSGMPIKLTDSMAGTFTASYDADGQMVKRGFPNGLTAETAYDATGMATDLTYTKASSCGTSCTWLDFEVTRSAGGKILSEAGSLGTYQFSYDPVGRLKKAEEQPVGGGCTTRSYAYDPNSNRTSMTSIPPGIGGACSTSGGSSQGYKYDGADRLEATGLIYDAFGRITTLPSAYAGGGNLETSYFSNDLIASQSQGGVTNTFALDAALRQRQRVQGGGLEGTEIFHYAEGSDSPAWTELGQSWTRNITGMQGELAAVAQSGSETRLQLTNLHGDVVATTGVDPSVAEFSMAARLDEFGKPLSGPPGRFGWLGGAQRRTEFPSGVIQMGARSYVPSMGRFLSKDPIAGGSANDYDYGNADPINQFDPSGMKPHDNDCDPHIGGITGCQVWLHIKMWSPRRGRMGVRMIYRSNRALGIKRVSFEITYWVDEKDDIYKEGFVEMPPPHYLNSYPGVPSGCRGTDPCADNHDGSGTFACRPGNEYQIQIIFKYRYNLGSGVEETKILEVMAQEFCIYY